MQIEEDLRKAAEARRTAERASERERELIVEAYLVGVGVTRIAEITGRARQPIYELLRKRGAITPRPRR